VTILNDAQIQRRLMLPWSDPGWLAINPFHGGGKVPGKISSGLSSFGYDMRLAQDFKIPSFRQESDNTIDPKNPGSIKWTEVVRPADSELIIAPHSFVLGRSMEWFHIPRDVLAICIGKSTYARSGLIVNITPLEPEWEGHVTIEIGNQTPFPSKVYIGEGISQVLFLTGALPGTSYADRQGKYQGQTGVTLGKVE
jgi:dCTP deaminase